MCLKKQRARTLWSFQRTNSRECNLQPSVTNALPLLPWQIVLSGQALRLCRQQVVEVPTVCNFFRLRFQDLQAVPSIPTSNWNYLWELKLAPKILFFLSRYSSNALATKSILYRRNCVPYRLLDLPKIRRNYQPQETINKYMMGLSLYVGVGNKRIKEAVFVLLKFKEQQVK